MDEKIKVINLWLKKKSTFPHLLEIRPSAMCNLKCVYCNPRKQFLEGTNYIKKNNGLKLVDKEIYFEKIRECTKLRVSEIHIGGGEPFIRKDMIDIMKAIKEEGILGSIVTNGTLLNKNIVKELIEIKWDNILFSIDGPDEKLNDSLRGKKNAFNCSIKNIKRIVKMKKDKPQVALAPVISKKNQYKITEFVKLAKKLKVDKLIFQPVTLPQKSQKRFYINRTDKFKTYLKKSIDFSKRYALSSNLTDLFKFYFNPSKKEYNQFPICFEPLYHMTIQPNGNADPCPIVLQNAHKEIKVFNIKYKSLKSIWNGPYFKEFRKKLLNNKIPNKKFCGLCCGMIQISAMSIKDKLFEI